MANLLKQLTSKFHKPAVLELDLARGVLDIRPQNPLQALQLTNATTMATLRQVLGAAAEEDNIKGLIVHAAPGGVPLHLLDEIALEIERFGEHKPTAAWSESFGELAPSLGLFKMATAAQQVWVQPTGMLTLAGIEAQITLLKGGLNKLGIDPEFSQRHEYKSAGETYAGDEVSEANREMMTAIVESLVDDAVQTIARRRGMEPDVVRNAVDDSPICAENALDVGLIDHIGYRDEAYEALLKEWGAEPEELRYVARHKPAPDIPTIITKRKRKKIARVNIHGGIVTGRGTGKNIGSDVVDEHLRAAIRDDDVIAVILDVDSPGGSAVASDFIRRSVLQVKDSGKKVVARMGQYAASGGYYVSMGADEIVALPTTLTGSIGVVGGKLVTNRLFEKIGVIRESVTVDRGARVMSDAHPMDENSWMRLNRWLDRVYRDFTSMAAEDRGMEYEKLEAVARGRVWTGAQALELGLVDYLGGHRVANERAAFLAGVDVDDVEFATVDPTGLLAKFMPAASSETIGAAGGAQAMSAETLLSAALAELGIHADGALSMPWRIAVR